MSYNYSFFKSVLAVFIVIFSFSINIAKADTYYLNYQDGTQNVDLVLTEQLYTNTPLVTGASVTPRFYVDFTLCEKTIGNSYYNFCNNTSNYNDNQIQFGFNFVSPLAGVCDDGSTPYLGGAHAQGVFLPEKSYSGALYLDPTTVPSFTKAQYCTFTTQAYPTLIIKTPTYHYQQWSQISYTNTTWTVPASPSNGCTGPAPATAQTI